MMSHVIRKVVYASSPFATSIHVNAADSSTAITGNSSVLLHHPLFFDHITCRNGS